MTTTTIEWTDATWNPVRGCSRVSEGCRNCYAERQAARFSDHGQYSHGFVERTASGPRWTGRVELVPEKLTEPLLWKKPRRVFVNSMSDLFHDALPFEAIAQVFAVMAKAERHTFQVLTKRPERMREFVVAWDRGDRPTFALMGARFPLPNVWLGVSVEDQATADARIPILLETPAAVRFVSYEPALGPVDFLWLRVHEGNLDALRGRRHDDFESSGVPVRKGQRLDWVIVGGESGPGARPCDVGWIRSVLDQCRDGGVPVFVKQLGAHPTDRRLVDVISGEPYSPRLKCRRGGDPLEWPADLSVREFPSAAPRCEEATGD